MVPLRLSTQKFSCRRWKVLSLIALIVLFLAVFDYGVEITSFNEVYFSAHGPVPGIIPGTGENVSLFNLGELAMDIEGYCKGTSIINQWVLVSDNWCPIRNWAENLYDNGTTQFYVTFGNQTYAVFLTAKQIGSASAFNLIISIITALMWIAFVYGVYKDRKKESAPERRNSKD